MSDVWALISQIGYLLGATAEFALAGWLVIGRRGVRSARFAIVMALLLTAAHSLALIALGSFAITSMLLASLSNFAWLWTLYRLFSQDLRHRKISPIRPVILALTFVELLQIFLALLYLKNGGTLEVLRLQMIFRLLVSIGALVLVHNLYVGASPQMRAALRWPAAALTVMWLYDLNLHAIGYLIDAVPSALVAVRSVIFLIVTGLFAIAALDKSEVLTLQPSRSITFQLISLLVIGGYLAMMVTVAQFLSYTGGDYARLVQMVFIALASAVALLVLPSKKLRGWLRVKIAKNLFQHRYDYREEWLRFNQTIGRADPEMAPLHERIVQAVADLTDSPSGLLFMPDADGLSLQARWRWKMPAPASVVMTEETMRFYEETQFILHLGDWRQGLSPNVPDRAVPEWFRDTEQVWALVPLIHFSRLIGIVVLARPAVEHRLDWEDLDLLRVVGRQAASYLAEQASQDALSEAQRFDEFNRRIAFVMHDIKNLASQLSLLAHNAQKHSDNPAFRADMLITLRNSSEKLNGLLARLGRYGAGQSDKSEVLRLHSIADKVAARFQGNGMLHIDVVHDCPIIGNQEALEQALCHLVQNAIEASSPEQAVYLRAYQEDDFGVIEISDSGQGMSTEFIRLHLFKPFHSSKSGGFGIGAFEARELVKAMGGRLQVESCEGEGSSFIIRIPCHSEAAAGGNVTPQKAKVI